MLIVSLPAGVCQPIGFRLATASWSGLCKLWSVPGAKQVKQLRGRCTSRGSSPPPLLLVLSFGKGGPLCWAPCSFRLSYLLATMLIVGVAALLRRTRMLLQATTSGSGRSCGTRRPVLVRNFRHYFIILFWAVSNKVLSSISSHARCVMFSTWCPCLLGADRCLRFDVMPDLGLQAKSRPR